MCRACGFMSECHGEDDPQEGECHEECAGSLAAVIDTMDDLVNELIAIPTERNRAILVQAVAADPRVEFDRIHDTVRLFGCGGMVAREWTLRGVGTKPHATDDWIP